MTTKEKLEAIQKTMGHTTYLVNVGDVLQYIYRKIRWTEEERTLEVECLLGLWFEHGLQSHLPQEPTEERVELIDFIYGLIE